MDSITKFHVPDIFWFDKNCLLSIGGEYARYERYIQPDKNIRKLLRMGIIGVWDVSYCFTTGYIGCRI